ncbi:1-phosphatidylinositol 3-phosphate 5-kinase [Globisporangium polare]
MEISGIGGYRDGLVARSSVTSVRTAVGATADAGPNSSNHHLMEKPPASRSVSGAAMAVGGSTAGRRLQGGHRASEPIMLDFDLPSPASAARRQQQLLAQQQKRGSKSATMNKSDGSGGSSSSSRTKRKSVPRLDNLTPSVHIDDEGKAALKEAAEERIARMMLKSQAAWDGTNGIFDDPKDWKPHMTKSNLSVYRLRSGPGSDQSISTYRPFVATGRMPGITLQDIEYGLYAETTPDERAINAFWFSDYFLDAAVLATFESHTEEDPFHFFGMKWMLTGSIGGVKIMSPRDNAFMQYQKTLINEHGEKILVKVVESVPESVIPFIPDQGDLHFVRSELSIIYLYRYDAKSKEVQVFCEGKIDPAGRTPPWMANINLSLFSPLIVQLDFIADAKYITKHGLMFPHEKSPAGQSTIALSVSTNLPSPMASSRADSKTSQLTASWVPNHQRKACYVCFKSFGILKRHRHHCRMCGEVMCGRCMITLPLVAPPQFDADKDENFPLLNQPSRKKLDDTNPHGFPVVNSFKFCKKCMFAIRQERRAMTAGVGNYYFTEGMVHHYEQMQAAFAGHYNNQFEDEGNESGYLDSSLEDESVIDDIQYSKRIEKLRQEHMEREKQKLRDQQKNHIARSSVRLFDESVVSASSSDSVSRKPSNGSDGYGFENLVVTDCKKPPMAQTRAELLKSKSDSDQLSTRSSAQEDTAPSSSVAFSSTMPLTSTTGATTTGSKKAPNDSANASRGSSLLPIDIRRRSFSIPDHFEKMERSIAEQEALISSIQQQRAKAQQGADAAQARLPIGAAMRSMAQTNPSVLSTITNGVNNQVEDKAGHSNAATSMSTESQSPQ